MTSPFVSSLVKEHGSIHYKQYGENGAVEYLKHGVKGDGSRDVEGYLTAAFSGWDFTWNFARIYFRIY